jgi:hypothetical protein
MNLQLKLVEENVHFYWCHFDSNYDMAVGTVTCNTVDDGVASVEMCLKMITFHTTT